MPFQTFLFRLLCLLALVSPVHADRLKLAPEVLHSVMKLTSEGGETCATAFLVAEGVLATNAHVTRALCPGGNCRRVRLFRSSRLDGEANERIELSSIELVFESPAIDVAFLKAPELGSGRSPFTIAVSPQLKGNAFALGFPSCGPLTLREGTINGADSLWLYTSVNGAHGSSGSPIFGGDLQLLGMVDQAQSIIQGTLSLASTRSFNLRGIQANHLIQFLDRDPNLYLAHEISLLLELYNDELKGMQGLLRLRRGLDFLGSMEGLRLELARTPSLASLSQLFSTLERDIYELVRLTRQGGIQTLPPQALALALAAALETKGPYRNVIQNIEPRFFLDDLRAAGLSGEHLRVVEDLFMRSNEDSYPGIEKFGLLVLLACAAVMLPLIALWAYTLGYAYTGFDGGFIARCFKLLLTAVFWPISLIWVGVARRVSARARS